MLNQIDEKIMTESFDIDAENLYKALAFIKTAGDNGKIAGLIKPMSGFVEHYRESYNHYGVRERARISDRILREIERKNPIISACVNLRCRQMRSFSIPQDNINLPGFKIEYIGQKKITQKIRDEIEVVRKFIYNAGFEKYESLEDRCDNFHDILTMMARDYMTIDKVAIELRRDKKGAVVDFRIIDAATIRKVLPGGMHVSYDFDARSVVYADSKYFRKLLDLREIPPLEEIAYVQEIDGVYVAAFRANELIFDIMNKRTDIRYRYDAYSPIEQAISCITGFLNALAYNAEAFSTAAMPKIGLAFEAGDFTQEEFERLQDQWIANYRGIKGSWRIPLFNGKVNVIDLMKSPRDFEYGKYIEITGALICSIMGVDPAEIGLRLNQAQNVLSENVDAKMKFSKDRGLHDLLGQIQSVLNKILAYAGVGDRCMLTFTGLNPEDAEAVSKLRNESVRRDKTVNELRKEQGLEPLEFGDIILDNTYYQYYMAMLQQKSEQEKGGGEEEEEEGIEGLLDEEAEESARDEVVDELSEEYSGIVKARTMLI